MNYNKIFNPGRSSVINILIIMIACLSVKISAIDVNPGRQSGQIKKLITAGDDLMKKRELGSYEEALTNYRRAVSLAPDDADIMIKTAGALNHIMRVKTNSNTINIDGSTQDNDRNKAIWKRYGVEAVKYAKAAAAKRPKDVNALVAYTEGFMYYMSSFGVFQAIFEGAVGQYKSNANALIENFPEAEDAMGYVYMGVFYLIAPWPMSDSDEARRLFRKAVELAPGSVANHYYVAVQAMKDEDYKLAEKELNFVIDNSCNNGQEFDYCGYLKSEAKKGLSLIRKNR